MGLTLPERSSIVHETGQHVTYRDMVPHDVGPALTVMRLSEGQVSRTYPGPTSDSDLGNRQLRLLEQLLLVPGTAAHVATSGDQIVGMSVALRQENLWGLSTLFVAPGHQGKGIGSTLMKYAMQSAEDARYRLIISSADPRAMRTYLSAGFRLNPAMGATGSIDPSALPATRHVTVGEAADMDVVAKVDSRLRGGSRASIGNLLIKEGARLLVARHKNAHGFVIHLHGAPLFCGTPLILGADTQLLAEELFVAFLRETHGKTVNLFFLTHRQQWIYSLLERLRFDLFQIPPVFSNGYRALPAFWIPSGIFF